MQTTLVKYLILKILLLSCLNIIAQQSGEYQTKAGYIGKFAQYVDWSEHKDFYHSESFIIAIIGETPLDTALLDFYKTQKIDDKNVIISHITNISQIKNPQVLFIADNNMGKLPEIIKFTINKPILTIGDTKEYGKKGVHINFYLQNDVVRFIINKKMAENAGLKINSLLLRVAKLVD